MIVLEKHLPASPVNLHYLHQITDSQTELMIELMDTFIQQAPQALQSIRLAWEQQDASLLHRAVHKARPGFQYIGATAIEQQLNHLEVYSQHQEPTEKLEETIQQIEKLTQEAVNQLEEEKKYLLRE